MIINEDYLDRVTIDVIDIENDVDNDVVTTKDTIDPEKYYYCITFYLRDDDEKLTFHRRKQMLDTFLDMYFYDYSVCVLPFREAVNMNGSEKFANVNAFETSWAHSINEDSEVVFIQFNADKFDNIFIVRLCAFLLHTFDNIEWVKPEFYRADGETFDSSDSISPDEQPLKSLSYKYAGNASRGIEAMKSLLSGSPKNKEDITSFILYLRLFLMDPYAVECINSGNQTKLEKEINRFYKKFLNRMKSNEYEK